MTELALTLAAAAEDRLAVFERLMRRYERLVLGTALRILGNLPDAQDAAQEVFLRMYRNLDRIEDPEACAPWLYRITVNVCRDLHRKRPPSVPVDQAGDIAAETPDPQRLALLSERQHALNAVLRRLPEKERAALVLRDLEGLSTAEAAAALGSTEATVRSQVARARIKIRESFERFFGRRP
jgi:RNA polymerase sigma-70 factor (ECF subfamily)